MLERRRSEWLGPMTRRVGRVDCRESVTRCETLSIRRAMLLFMFENDPWRHPESEVAARNPREAGEVSEDLLLGRIFPRVSAGWLGLRAECRFFPHSLIIGGGHGCHRSSSPSDAAATSAPACLRLWSLHFHNCRLPVLWKLNSSSVAMSSSMACSRLAAWTLAAVVLQILGLYLFMFAFFPVRPALSGLRSEGFVLFQFCSCFNCFFRPDPMLVLNWSFLLSFAMRSGPESFLMPTCDTAEFPERKNLPPHELRALYKVSVLNSRISIFLVFRFVWDEVSVGLQKMWNCAFSIEISEPSPHTSTLHFSFFKCFNIFSVCFSSHTFYVLVVIMRYPTDRSSMIFLECSCKVFNNLTE